MSVTEPNFSKCSLKSDSVIFSVSLATKILVDAAALDTLISCESGTLTSHLNTIIDIKKQKFIMPLNLFVVPSFHDHVSGQQDFVLNFYLFESYKSET